MLYEGSGSPRPPSFRTLGVSIGAFRLKSTKIRNLAALIFWNSTEILPINPQVSITTMSNHRAVARILSEL